MDNAKNDNSGDKKKEKSNFVVPNPFLFENFTRSLSILNFMINSQLLEKEGAIENKKQWRKNIVAEWLNNMKKFLNENVNSYSKIEKKIRKLNKQAGIKENVVSTEEMHQSINKNLLEFEKFLGSILTEHELDDKED